MRKPSAAHSIRPLIRNLTSSDRDKVRVARARLTILGARAVEPLIDTLEGGNDRLKLLAMPILALIRDRRAQGPLIALLRDREPKIREAAARALSQFPSRETIVCLEKFVKHELRAEVRIAAVQSLITLFDEGHEEALHELLGAIFDPDEARRVRLASMSVLPLISARERRAVLKKLRADADREIAQKARTLEAESERSEPDHLADALRLTAELASSHHERWNEAMHRLIALGSRVFPSLIAAMRARHKDPEFASRAAMVLKGLGPRRLRPVAHYLETVVEPLPLEVLVDVVASLEDRPLTYRLCDLIDSLDARSASINGFAGPDPYARVRGKAHLALARLGSRVAVADLKKTLCTPARRLDADLLSAAGRIGTRAELTDLLRAYQREEPWMRAKIRDVFWQIVRREKIRRGGPLFQSLAKQDREALRDLVDDRPASQRSPSLPGLGPRAAHPAAPAGGAGRRAPKRHARA